MAARSDVVRHDPAPPARPDRRAYHCGERRHARARDRPRVLPHDHVIRAGQDSSAGSVSIVRVGSALARHLAYHGSRRVVLAAAPLCPSRHGTSTGRGRPCQPVITDPRGARQDVPAIIDKVLRAGEGKILRKLQRIVEQVNSIEEDYEALSDAELRALTDEFKERYADGETLDDLLPEAFAAIREAAKRTLGQRHFDVQLMGGAALHLGNIAEMKTGEGKTLTGVLRRLPERAGRQGRAHRHGQRLPGQARRRVDGPDPPVPRPRGRRDPGRDGAGTASQAVRRRHHLRHQQRVRLRLPQGQHGLGARTSASSAATTSRSSTRWTRS